MSQVAIDALPAATTPLAGTEPVPIVQGGVTKQVPASAFTGGALGFAYTIEGASFTAVAGGRYGILTASVSPTVTLPASSLGAAIEVTDVNHNANVNNIVLSAVGSDQIVLQSSTLPSQTISTPGAVIRLICYATNRWRALLIASA